MTDRPTPLPGTPMSAPAPPARRPGGCRASPKSAPAHYPLMDVRLQSFLPGMSPAAMVLATVINHPTPELAAGAN